MSVAVAFRAFFTALFNSQKAEAIRDALDANQHPDADQTEAAKRLTASASTAPATTSATPAPPTPPKASRSDAVAILATLQREARLVDLIQEPLDHYSDAQVGAAARPCLTQCRSTLSRIFDLKPLLVEPEGQLLEIPTDASPLRYQWVGETGANLKTGKLVHPGWQARRCEIAQWTGTAEDANVIAPAQIEP